jgi:methionine-rich copper-binding protein CopC
MKVAAAIVAVIALAALPGIVLSHATLVSSDPTNGATITTPYTLTATFAEDVDPTRSTLTVENSSGTIVASGTVNATDASETTAEMTAQLPALPNGTYTVRWTTVTPDDNGIERGTYTFNVGSGNATPAPTAPPATGGTGSGFDVLTAVVLGVILIGAVVALVIIRGRR